MLFKQRILDGIADGKITLAFRKWRRPTVKTGGTLNTAIGVLAIDDVAIIDEATITNQDAVRAGYETLSELREDLSSHDDGIAYRISFRHIGDDPRIALRANDKLQDADFASIRERLVRFDSPSPWTLSTLDLIAKYPGTRAAELASILGQETMLFKTRVRKLKALGLTESLEVGYRLSPRGIAVRDRLRAFLPPA